MTDDHPLPTTVVIPWRDSDPDRAQALTHVTRALAAILPDARIILADSGHQPFSIAASRNRGVHQAEPGIVVICDADTIPEPEPLHEAIHAAKLDGLLHLPYTHYRALSSAGTAAYQTGTPLAACASEHETTSSQGGLLVTRTDTWQTVGGMDERFQGWGFEDAAFYAAVTTLHGPVPRHTGTIHHLWHPTAVNPTSPDYAANRALCLRYEKAHGNPTAMRNLQAGNPIEDPMTAAHIINAWNQPQAVDAIHPTRGISEDAYWTSGKTQAAALAADIPAGARVLDFGAGDGRVTIPLRALGYNVTAADASENMLAALTANDSDIPTFQSDGTDLGKHLGRRKFDAVYCLAVLIHHSYTTGEQLITNLRNVVKKGGLLILDWPASANPVEGAAWLDVTTWPQDRQDKLIEQLKLTRIDDGQPWQVFRA